MTRLSKQAFVDKYNTRFGDNVVQAILESDFREFAVDLYDSFRNQDWDSEVWNEGDTSYVYTGNAKHLKLTADFTLAGGLDTIPDNVIVPPIFVETGGFTFNDGGLFSKVTGQYDSSKTVMALTIRKFRMPDNTVFTLGQWDEAPAGAGGAPQLQQYEILSRSTAGTGDTEPLDRNEIKRDALLMPFEFVNDGETLSAAVARIGASRVVLKLRDTHVVTANLTIPSNITLDADHLGLVSPDVGIVVTVQGKIIASDQQIFTGAGTVVTSHLRKNIAWWGAQDDTDCSTIIQGIVDSHINNGYEIYIPDGFTALFANIECIDPVYHALTNEGIIKRLRNRVAAGIDDNFLFRVVDAVKVDQITGTHVGTFDDTFQGQRVGVPNGADAFGQVADLAARNSLTGLSDGSWVYVTGTGQYFENLGTGTSGAYVDNDFVEIWPVGGFCYYFIGATQDGNGSNLFKSCIATRGSFTNMGMGGIIFRNVDNRAVPKPTNLSAGIDYLFVGRHDFTDNGNESCVRVRGSHQDATIRDCTSKDHYLRLKQQAYFGGSAEVSLADSIGKLSMQNLKGEYCSRAFIFAQKYRQFNARDCQVQYLGVDRAGVDMPDNFPSAYKVDDASPGAITVFDNCNTENSGTPDGLLSYTIETTNQAVGTTDVILMNCTVDKYIRDDSGRDNLGIGNHKFINVVMNGERLELNTTGNLVDSCTFIRSVYNFGLDDKAGGNLIINPTFDNSYFRIWPNNPEITLEKANTWLNMASQDAINFIGSTTQKSSLKIKDCKIPAANQVVAGGTPATSNPNLLITIEDSEVTLEDDIVLNTNGAKLYSRNWTTPKTNTSASFTKDKPDVPFDYKSVIAEFTDELSLSLGGNPWNTFLGDAVDGEDAGVYYAEKTGTADTGEVREAVIVTNGGFYRVSGIISGISGEIQIQVGGADGQILSLTSDGAFNTVVTAGAASDRVAIIWPNTTDEGRVADFKMGEVSSPNIAMSADIGNEYESSGNGDVIDNLLNGKLNQEVTIRLKAGDTMISNTNLNIDSSLEIADSIDRTVKLVCSDQGATGSDQVWDQIGHDPGHVKFEDVQTASFAVTRAMAGKIIKIDTTAGAITATADNDLPEGFTVAFDIVTFGAGNNFTFAAAGTERPATTSLTAVNQFGTVIHEGSNNYRMIGGDWS